MARPLAPIVSAGDELKRLQAQTDQFSSPGFLESLFGVGAGQRRTDLSRAAEAEGFERDQQRAGAERARVNPLTAQAGLAQARALGLDASQLSQGERMGAGVNAFQQAQGGLGPDQIGSNLAFQSPENQQLIQDDATLRQQAIVANQQALEAGPSPFRDMSVTDAVGLQMDATALSQGIADVQTLDSLLTAFPTWTSLAFDPEAQGTAKTAVIGTMAAVNSLLELGALTKDEREYLADFADDPDSIMQRMFNRDDRTHATYGSLISKLETKRQAFSGIMQRAGKGGLIDFSDINTGFEAPNFDVVKPTSGSPTRERAKADLSQGGGLQPGVSIF